LLGIDLNLNTLCFLISIDGWRERERGRARERERERITFHGSYMMDGAA